MHFTKLILLATAAAAFPAPEAKARNLIKRTFDLDFNKECPPCPPAQVKDCPPAPPQHCPPAPPQHCPPAPPQHCPPVKECPPQHCPPAPPVKECPPQHCPPPPPVKECPPQHCPPVKECPPPPPPQHCPPVKECPPQHCPPVKECPPQHCPPPPPQHHVAPICKPQHNHFCKSFGKWHQGWNYERCASEGTSLCCQGHNCYSLVFPQYSVELPQQFW